MRNALTGLFHLGQALASAPVVDDDGTIYVGLDDGTLLALHPDGSRKWTFATEGLIYHGSPVIGPDGTIYVGTLLNNKLFAINADGTKKWDFAADSGIWSTPAIDRNGAAYFATYEGKLYCVNAAGIVQWTYPVGRLTTGSPALGLDGALYIGSGSGTFYAIQAGAPLAANSPWPKFGHDLSNTGKAGGNVALRIIQQPQSMTVTEGASVNFSVTAVAEAPLTYQWRFNGADIAGAINSTLVVRVARASNTGVYQVLVSNTHGSSLSMAAKLNVLAPVPFVQRHLPVNYYAGNTMRVTLSAAPPDSATVYALQDQPPAGWAIGAISDGGSYDAANHRVKFGPFFDHVPRELSYEVTPPFLAQGSASAFSGQGSAEGVSSLILGDSLIDLAGLLHPADRLVIDNRISIDEVTTYASAWRRGELWPIAPNPIPIEFVSRAGALWKDGEEYVYDPSMATPVLRWINRSGPASFGLHGLSLSWTLSVRVGSGGTAVSELPPLYVPTEVFSVAIKVAPSSDVKVYAVEDQLPPGWSANRVSDNGAFDPVNRRVKWGPFFDNMVRRLTYEVTSPASASGAINFEGVASFDGANAAVTGARSTRATARLTLNSTARNEFELQLRGEVGAVYALEFSEDLKQWTMLASLTNITGTVIFSDPVGEAIQERFYRVRIRE